MTKKMLVFLPCLALALAFAGCGASGGSGGNAHKGADAFASMDNDPIADGLAKGYVSTLVGDFRGNPAVNVQPAVSGATPTSRQILIASPVQGRAVDGQVGASTLAPSRQSGLDMRFDPLKVRARDVGNGKVEVTAGGQTAFVGSADRGGKTYSYSVGADGSVTVGDNTTFPRIVEAAGIGRGVILGDGSVTPVE